MKKTIKNVLSKDNICALICGAGLGVGCIYPDNIITPIVVFSEICLLFFLYTVVTLRHFFLVGLSFHLVSMWWLAPTLEKFGGMPAIAGLALMLLHSILSSVQFVLVLFLTRKFDKVIHFFVSFPLLWVLSELSFPRMFPWAIADYFIHLPWITSYAQVVGAFGVSFILIALAGGFTLNLILRRKIVRYVYIVIVMIVVSLGTKLATLIDDPDTAALALVVQGNLGLDEKGYEEHYEKNLQKYVSLTTSGLEALQNQNQNVSFIVWPESVVSKWHDLERLEYDFRTQDPFPEGTVPLIYGGLGFKKAGRDPSIYNAGILRDTQGKMSGYTAKKILMPFGEYVPFANFAPWIRDLTPIKKDFSVGDVDMPILVNTVDGKQIKVGVNICYEDLSSDLSRDQVSRGAQVLVNLTNDAWYGNSPAPYQHNLLARFRAIETQRYFIRSTNTGLTTLINPRGEIKEQLPLFSEATSAMNFYVKDGKTLFVQYGNLILYSIMAIYSIFVIVLLRYFGVGLKNN